MTDLTPNETITLTEDMIADLRKNKAITIEVAQAQWITFVLEKEMQSYEYEECGDCIHRKPLNNSVCRSCIQESPSNLEEE